MLDVLFGYPQIDVTKTSNAARKPVVGKRLGKMDTIIQLSFSRFAREKAQVYVETSFAMLLLYVVFPFFANQILIRDRLPLSVT